MLVMPDLQRGIFFYSPLFFLSMEDDLVRRKRVNGEGEWEYECRSCELWLPKEEFRGCKNLVDAYGNCLMCKKCIGRKIQKSRMDNESEAAAVVLEAIGFLKFKDSDEWWESRKNLPWHTGKWNK